MFSQPFAKSRVRQGVPPTRQAGSAGRVTCLPFNVLRLALLTALTTVATVTAGFGLQPVQGDRSFLDDLTDYLVALAQPEAPRPMDLDPADLHPTDPDAPPDLAVDLAWHLERVEVRDYDKLVSALARHDVAPAVAEDIGAALETAGVDPSDVRAGDRLRLLQFGHDRLVASVSYSPNPWTRYDVSTASGKWLATRHEVQPEVRLEVYHGEVRNSLSEAIEEGGVEPHVARQFAQTLESELEFGSETRPGDRYRLLVEAIYSDGDLVDHGRVLAAQYLSDGATVTGVAFEIHGRLFWYDEQGESLRRTFLHSPVEFSRISSGFTQRRRHPILGGVRPHLAIDFAAPVGTQVWAVADGVVKSAGRDSTNGVQVVLEHRNGYETYYNHLSRVAAGLKPGHRVSQKQVIGYVGNTGLSTGPHLCYRVAKDGVFVNPLSDEFMPGEPLVDAVRPQFEALVRAYLEQLSREAPFDTQADAPQERVRDAAYPDRASDPEETLT